MMNKAKTFVCHTNYEVVVAGWGGEGNSNLSFEHHDIPVLPKASEIIRICLFILYTATSRRNCLLWASPSPSISLSSSNEAAYAVYNG